MTNISYPGHIANDVEMIPCQYVNLKEYNRSTISRECMDTDMLMNVCIWKDKRTLWTCSHRNALQSPGTHVI